MLGPGLFFSFLFCLSLGGGAVFRFSLSGGHGGKEIGEPRYNAHVVGDGIWVFVCFKGEKMGVLSVKVSGKPPP